MVFFGNQHIYGVEMKHLLTDVQAYKQTPNEGEFDLIK
jgi:hypothetical protein